MHRETIYRWRERYDRKQKEVIGMIMKDFIIIKYFNEKYLEYIQG